MDEGIKARRPLMKKETSTEPRMEPCGASPQAFDFEKPHKPAYLKGKMESNKQSKVGGRPK